MLSTASWFTATFSNMNVRQFYLKEWRTGKDISLESLASKTELTIKCIVDLESGAMMYDEDTLTCLALALNCHPHQIIQGPPQKDEVTLFAQCLRDICSEATNTFDDMGKLSELKEHRLADEVWVSVASHLYETMSQVRLGFSDVSVLSEKS